MIAILVCALMQGCASKLSTNDLSAQQEFRRLMNINDE